jgi:iron complex outermembrane receptor protein
MPPSRFLAAFLLSALLALFFCPPGLAQEEAADLSGLEMEDLMQVQVVTPSRRAESLSQVAGAVTVLDEEDIRRSGATNIPEALKLIPGVHVAQIDTEKWAVGIRGFNGMFDNKHLVLLDGRPITSSARTNVAWSNESIPLETVKRIEVVRGAWTSLWGSDSFTGVINIITKRAAETQGWQSVSLAGTDGLEQTLRNGGSAGEDLYYRIYAKGSYQDGSQLQDQAHQATSTRDWTQGRTGARIDWNNAATDELSLQGELVQSQFNEGAGAMPHMAPPQEKENYGGYWQLAWDRATGLGSGLHFRTSYTRELDTDGGLEGTSNVWDAELQHVLELGDRNLLSYGLGTRYYWDSFKDKADSRMETPNSYRLETSAFLQDKLTLVQDSLFLILGLKFDYLGSGNLETQPTVRLLQTLEDQEYWLAVSRAVRPANRWQDNGFYRVRYQGVDYDVRPTDSLTSEELIAYEAGYRRHISKLLAMEVSLFANDYDRLTKLELNGATRTGKLVNSLSGMSYGVESLLEWQARQWLTLRPSVSFIRQDFQQFSWDDHGDSLPKPTDVVETKLMVMSDLGHGVGLDVDTAYLDSPTEERLDSYWTMDAHLSWKAREGLLLELIGQNLLGARQEFSVLEVDTSLALRVTWDF